MSEAEEEEAEDHEQEEEEAAAVEEAPPAELNGRAFALREMCVEELGDALLDQVYTYLHGQQHAADADAGGYADAEYDERMRADLLQLMGESKLRLWPLVDQLVFLEEFELKYDT